MEHVAAERNTWTWKVQSWLDPVQICVADNCHFTRLTWTAIENAGFSEVEHERFWLKSGRNLLLIPLRPMLIGYAIK